MPFHSVDTEEEADRLIDAHCFIGYFRDADGVRYPEFRISTALPGDIREAVRLARSLMGLDND